MKIREDPCPVCGGEVEDLGGRPRVYCSASCRQEAHVRRRVEASSHELKMLLLEWFYDMDGIADEMTLYQNQSNGERFKDLLAIGVEPYDHGVRAKWLAWRKETGRG